MSPPLHVNALTALIASDMGQQICSMYDEFRIRSCKCKIYPSIANTFTTTGQFQLHTAWDRNGSLQIFYPTNEDKFETYGRFLEIPADIKTYSSLMTKPLLQYQAGTV